MTEPKKHDLPEKFGPSRQTPLASLFAWCGNGPKIRWILAVALLIRLLASFVVQYVADRRDTLCLFGDTPIYWQYALAIADGTPYVVYQWDIPHYALRTPGYPLWLAFWIELFGESTTPIRLGQAALGVCAVWWVYLLAKLLSFSETSARWSAAIVAVDPFQVLAGTLLLTESLFTPLLVLFVWLWVRELWRLRTPDMSFLDHFSILCLGAMQATLSLIRPSWLFFFPFLIFVVSLQALRMKGVRKSVLVLSALIFGWGVVMAPWAIRNQQRFDRFAIGGTWGGASLYDAVRPGATGASEMSFVALPEFRKLGETQQDDLWKRLSYEEIRKNPGRIAAMAWEKQKRFWSAWPNDSTRVPVVIKAACAAIVWPIWFAMLIGIWRRRCQPMTYIVLSPLVYTAMTHLLFVGSSRYRVAVIIPSMIFVGEGFRVLMDRFGRSSHTPCETGESQAVSSRV